MRISAQSIISDLPSAELALLQVAVMVENRDENCAGHAERLAQYAAIVGNELNLPRRDVVALIKASFFHDIGMLIVPESTLNKPEPLTPEDRERVTKHPLAGAALLEPVGSLRDVVPVVKYHHERANGLGYPDKLTREQIPDLAQVFSVLDVFDALTSVRAHRPAYSVLEALGILKEEAEWGNHDSDIVTCLNDIVENRKFEDVDKEWRVCPSY